MTTKSGVLNRTFNLGVKHKLLIPEETILLLNQAAILTSMGAFLLSAICYFFLSIPIYAAYTITISLLYLVIPVLHYFKKPFWVQIYITFILCNWIYVIMILSGTFFGQGVASLVTIKLGYFFFPTNKQLQVLAVIYNSIMFIAATSYSSFYQHLFIIPEVPFDEVCVFTLSLSWIYVIFPFYEMQRENFISSLKSKNEVLEKTTAELERFTHIASHDLKSPLRTIISFLDLVERDIKRNQMDNVLQNLTFAKSGARQLNYLIEDVLEFSKIKSNIYQQVELVSLSNVMEKVLFNLKAEIQEKNTVIEVARLPNCHCNETEFVLVFQNLIQNGIKYNVSKNPTIQVTSELTQDGFAIHFQDNGIGIDVQYFEKIFEHFKRLHTAQEYTGTGLGLSLCKKIIEKYNGKIKVQSNPGQGSIFTIYVPAPLIEWQPQDEKLS